MQRRWRRRKIWFISGDVGWSRPHDEEPNRPIGLLVSGGPTLDDVETLNEVI